MTLLLASACGSEGADGHHGETATVPDTTDMVIVYSDSALWQPGDAWRLAPDPHLSIGAAGRSTPATLADQFTNISALFTLPDGRILVANEDDPPQIRIFSSSGTHLTSIGQEGEGPGEFGAVTQVWLAPPDTLVTFDQHHDLVSRFTDEGQYVSRVLIERSMVGGNSPISQRMASRTAFWGRFSDGTFLFRSLYSYSWPPMGTEGSGRANLTEVRALANGSIVDTLGTFPAYDWVGLFIGAIGTTPPLFGKYAAYLVHDSSFYTGIGDDFVIDQYDVSGQHVRRIKRRFEPRPVTAEMAERFVESRLAAYPNAKEGPMRRRVAMRLQGSNTLPAFSTRGHYDRNLGLLIDDQGNLWVPHFRLEYDYEWEAPTGTSEWSVFGSDGRWMGVVKTPANLEPTDIGADYVLGVWTDELDVETVRRYRLIKGSG